MPQMVRIDLATHGVLARIARATHMSMTDALAVAVEEQRRRMIMDAFDAGYAQLRGDPEAWAKETAERELWDSTNNDGLKDE